MLMLGVSWLPLWRASRRFGRALAESERADVPSRQFGYFPKEDNRVSAEREVAQVSNLLFRGFPTRKRSNVRKIRTQ
jgi:hypothetical protein